MVADFININSFVARLMIRYPYSPAFSFSLFALWTMRGALQTANTEATAADPPEAFIPAAAAWIHHAGSQMRQWNEEFLHGTTLESPGEWCTDASQECWSQWPEGPAPSHRIESLHKTLHLRRDFVQLPREAKQYNSQVESILPKL